ncbi:DUF397 domain-containing protein [Streptomyces sp. NPDC088337]|uniref:DUF397 domain-containing protein n=1 Tax=unclassified Streptomyces TaxID=2593676 RepID=UPI002DD7A811|nr:DUF397 domain-containing protein [Streptomyces sp. NBC_01788]WSB30214.1 DUF397 domain-containing protein [Streptomyces sp. NBC_01788]
MSTNSQLEWFKSSYSGSEGDSCVEVALALGAVHVRDSKQIDGPRFEVASPAWAEFLGFVG